MMKKCTLWLVLACLFSGLFVSTYPQRSEAIVIDSVVPRFFVPLTPDAIADYARCMAPNPAVYGFAVGTVYCFKKLTTAAVQQYTTAIKNSVIIQALQYSCYVAALVFLGIRFMTHQTDFMVKDTLLTLVKMVISVWLISNATELYTWLTSGISELIAFVASPTGLGGVIVPPDSCVMMEIPKQLLLAVDSSVNYDEYAPWHMIDCILLRVFGLTIPMPLSSFFGVSLLSSISVGGVSAGAVPSVIKASMLTIFALAAATGTIGMIVLGLGLTLVFTLLKTIFRCIYMVLFAYLALCSLIIMLPIFAPLLVFNGHTDDSLTRQIFDRFIGYIVSCFIAPACIIGYVCFMVVCIDSLIEGDTSSNTAIKAIYSTCKPNETTGNNPNICSFQNLFKTLTQIVGNIVSPAAGSAVVMNGTFSHITDNSQPLFTWKIVADPLTGSNNCQVVNRKLTFIPQGVVEMMNQVSAKSVGITIPGPAQLKVPYILLVQLATMLLTAVILISVLAKLLDSIPHMIHKMIDMVGGGALIAFSSPLDGILDGAKNGMMAGMRKGERPSGIMGGILGMPGQAARGLGGAAQGIVDAIVGRRR